MEIDPLEIWMMAGLLVDEHGHDAIGIAQQRADKAMTENDAVGHATWRAVRNAAEIYLKSHPRPSRRPH
jgi:hypothetical protein